MHRPAPDQPLRHLGFLTIGLFDPEDPAAGHESTLQIIELQGLVVIPTDSATDEQEQRYRAHVEERLPRTS